jgi:folate-dependent phosphoribosylglycinamide formyltransferase PurN
MLTGRSGPVRVALLSSRHAPALPYLLADAPGRGDRWDLVAFLTSDAHSPDVDRAHDAGLPVLVNDVRDFYEARGARIPDLGLRPGFDGRTAALLRPHAPDLVVLCGYLHILTAPMLGPYAGRVLNVHDADLTVLDPAGRPRYCGLHSTRDAIVAGAAETRSTVHIVTAEVDVGPALFRSWPFPVHPMAQDARRWGATNLLKAYAYAQREWMMRASWGPLLAEAIDAFARDEVRWLDGRVIMRSRLGPLELAAPAVEAPRGRSAIAGA